MGGFMGGAHGGGSWEGLMGCLSGVFFQILASFHTYRVMFPYNLVPQRHFPRNWLYTCLQSQGADECLSGAVVGRWLRLWPPVLSKGTERCSAVAASRQWRKQSVNGPPRVYNKNYSTCFAMDRHQ